MMRFYRREDGTFCKAVQFKSHAIDGGEGIFELLNILNAAGLQASWHPEELTDEWEENEAGDDYVQISIPEHIAIGAGNDRLELKGYIVEREGDVYIQAEELFEAIWSLSPSDDIDEWTWQLNKRLPGAKSVGYWENKLNPDAVSTDGGITYFLLSERPLYHLHGDFYQSAKTEGNKIPEGIQIADVCKHCGRTIVNFDTNGVVYKGFKHSAGRQNGLIRCWPEDTGQPYGLDATPRSYNV